MEKKIKALKFSMLMSILCSVLSGVNYLAFKLPVVGITFIITIIALIIQVVAYTIEMKNIKNNSVK